MKIPDIGELSTLDLNDKYTCFRVLSYDKRQLLEGMIIESIIDQVFSQLVGDGVIPVDHSTLVAKRRDRNEVAAVWIITDGAEILEYINLLTHAFPVIPVRYDNSMGEFLTSDKHITHCPPLPETDFKLHDKLQEWMRRKPHFQDISKHVRDQVRQNRSFWGYLESTYGERLGQIVLSRIFKNFGVQPFFDYAWDIDRVFIVSGRLWSLEIKHKFPAHDKRIGLYFGLNYGERDIIRKLEAGGISCLHIIVVKPIWDKDISPDYLRKDSIARTRAAILAVRLSPELLDKYSAYTGTSGSHTTLSGKGRLHFIKLPATIFNHIGFLSEPPEKLAGKIYHLMSGGTLPNVSDNDLKDLEISHG